jgi:hypothetical protein
MFRIIILLNFIKKNAKNYSMWQNIKSVIAFLCILVYIGAAAFAGMNVYNAVNEQRFESRQEFAELTDFAARAGALGFFTQDYIEDIRTRLDVSHAIDALIIDGPYGRAAFEKKSGLIAYNGDYPDFNKEMLLYGEPQTAPFSTDGGMTASISALSPLVDFNALLSTARLSFLAILVAVTLAFVMLIADVSIVKPAAPAPPATQKPLTLGNASSPDTPVMSAHEDAEVLSDGWQTDEQEEPEELAEAEDVVGWQTDEYEELEELDGNETPPEKIDAGAGLLAAASAVHQDDRFGGTDEGTELPGVLQQELTKAEKNGKDLAILNIEGTSADFPSEALIKQAAGFFKTGSRFFEKNDRTGVYIVVPDADLDEIFAAAKDFYRRAAAEAKSNGTDLLIGMSARSDRNVSGANLLNEAESALNKARADRSMPVVGFKADPKKYKDFIDRQRFPA